jgi:hypothetical protein
VTEDGKIRTFYSWSDFLRLAARLVLIVGLLATLPAHALGPVDGEAGMLTWVVDTGDYTDTSIDTASIGGYAEFWLDQRWGFRTALYRVSEDVVSMAPDEQTLIDLKYRVASLTDNTYVALGLGWEQHRFGAEGDASAARVLIDGRIGVLGALYLYGEAGWAPQMGDLGLRDDLSSISVETGLVLDPLPFVSVRLAWRYHITDYTGSITGASTRESSYGVVLGGGIHW